MTYICGWRGARLTPSSSTRASASSLHGSFGHCQFAVADAWEVPLRLLGCLTLGVAIWIYLDGRKWSKYL